MTKLTTATTATAIAGLYDDGTTDRTALIMAMVDKGASLNMATNGYSAFAKERGLTATIVSHKEEVLEGLSAEFDADSWTAEQVRIEVVNIVDGYGVAESTARDYCKAFSDLLGIEHPVADPRTAIFEWFKAQGADADKDEFLAYAKSLGRSRSNANEYWKGYELHLYLVG